jgi:hypothetical protein
LKHKKSDIFVYNISRYQIPENEIKLHLLLSRFWLDQRPEWLEKEKLSALVSNISRPGTRKGNETTHCSCLDIGWTRDQIGKKTRNFLPLSKILADQGPEKEIKLYFAFV